MIQNIEKLRGKISKAEVCRLGGISKAQYYNYLKGASIPYEVASKIIKGLGYKILIVKEIL